LKSRINPEVFGLRLYVAAHKKDAFTDQYSGSLKNPTFSTEPADFCLLWWAGVGPQLPLAKGKTGQ